MRQSEIQSIFAKMFNLNLSKPLDKGIQIWTHGSQSKGSVNRILGVRIIGWGKGEVSNF